MGHFWTPFFEGPDQGSAGASKTEIFSRPLVEIWTPGGQNRPRLAKSGQKGVKKGSKMAILAQKSGQKVVREWAFTYCISALGI